MHSGNKKRPEMENKLSITSRILVAFASGALIAVFFLPAWRIDLFAPQYPEGLTLNIWINGISGDVEIINGLNHYIGMKHINESMFPEFRFLPFVVGFYMLLGMLVAITGNRKYLFAYLILCVIGGALAMYDFYQWGYDYGHDLDPNAAIQVPGLSYQPPLFGHKRLLNFDAYSFPDVGGWVVIAAAALAFGVWAVERYRQYRVRKLAAGAYATALAISLVIITSCNAQPEPFQYGKDDCHFCKMTIMDPKFGCQLVTKKSRVYKFDDVICMGRFLHAGTIEEKDIKQLVVINYEKQNDLLDVQQCNFVVSPAVRSPMNSNAAAFASKEAATKFNRSANGVILTWKELLTKFQ
jgi:copper chaperone NosL